MSAIQRLIDRHAGEGTLDAAAELAQKDEALKAARELLLKIKRVSDDPQYNFNVFSREIDAALAKTTR